MNRIKKWELFESNLHMPSGESWYTEESISEFGEKIAVIKDILLELSDDNYEVNVDYANRNIYTKLNSEYHLSGPVIEIIIKKDFGSLWETDDEKMDFDYHILRVLEYAVSEGYKYKCEIVRFREIWNWRYVIFLYK